MKQRILVVVGSLVVVALLVCGGLFGYATSLPREHVASTELTIEAPPDRVFATIRDFGRMHQWAPDVVALQRVDGPVPMYRSDSEQGVLIYAITEEVPSERLVSELTAEPADFGGRWIWELEPAGDGTKVTLTEEGWVEPVSFRFLMTVTGMYDDNVIATTEALKAHLEP